ncbi:MAG TPA: hypothetical protein VIY69_10175 [Candidatus Acidoferrales bacterium]
MQFLFTLACICLLPVLCVSQTVPQDPPPPAEPSQSGPIELQHRPEQSEPQATPQPTVALNVPKGTPLEIALDSEVRVRHVGQLIHGRIVEPVYSFDKLEIPAGSEVTGKITQISGVSAGKRTEAALNADFTPARQIEVEFDEISLPDGKQVAVETKVTPGSGQLLDFVSAVEDANAKNPAGTEVAQKTHEAKQRAQDEWNVLMGQLQMPGKVHRAERYAVAQLPAHPQYIDAGTIYFAELQAPLNFGSEPLTLEMAHSIGDLSPAGGVVHARLEMGVTSAANRKGDPVDAVITQPLFENGRLIVPAGSVLAGTVVQVRPARRLNKNGQLRVAFHELRLPDGVPQAIEANLQSVQAGKSANVKLDSEGGARATTPQKAYVSTAVEIGLAGLSGADDDLLNRASGGVGGYKLIGIALGIVSRSRVLSASLGGYGAGMSVYTHFIARGRDVVFPKDTAMQIGLGVHDSSPPIPSPSEPGHIGD